MTNIQRFILFLLCGYLMFSIIGCASGIKGKVGLKAGTPLRIPGNISKIVEQFHALNR